MTMTTSTLAPHAEKIYAGVLGKIFGVYLGRPVEGWSYEDIRQRFGTVDHYVAGQLGVPLVVPDDDISGTFVFTRGLQDNLDRLPLRAEDIGNTWLNYIVENKTVLWFGGLSRSSEHTAFLRLKSGIKAPASGSIELNGPAMAEQIGAQIFIDGWGLSNPGDPEAAIQMARAAASVSHDSLSISAAAFVASMEAMAFDEMNLDVLMDSGLELVNDPRLTALVTEIRDLCGRVSDWREARDWIETNHGYDRYPSNSPIQTNHAAVIMSLIMGGNDWQRSVSICTSAGWDTDSNTGNVGCLNAIRLGLEGLDAGADFRTLVADRLYAVSADGGECISDAVLETRKIVAAATIARGETFVAPGPRFRFEYPGSVQGFRAHPGTGSEQALIDVRNTGDGLGLFYRQLAPGMRATASVETSPGPKLHARAGTSDFEVVGSPTLYPGQTVTATIAADDDSLPDVAFFIDHFGEDGTIDTISGERTALSSGSTTLSWIIPETSGRTIHRFGIELTSARRTDGAVRLIALDWAGAPKSYKLGKSYELTPELTPWTTDTVWMRTFVSSAANFAPDYTTTFCVSHPSSGGVVTTGTRDWADYRVKSRIQFNASEGAGLVARARGHRRYYSALLVGTSLKLVKQFDDALVVLAEATMATTVDAVHDLELRVSGDRLEAVFDGATVLTAVDADFPSGGAGFVVHSGAVLADGFEVESLSLPSGGRAA